MSEQTILIIDDNPTNLSVLTSFLECYDFEILVATDGEDGLAIAQKVRPDLVLLDIVMPGMDGYEVCRRLKSNPRTQEIPVIFITSIVSTEDKVKGFEAGAIDYLTKPVHAEEVLARIHTHLRIQELTQSLLEANAVLTKRARQLEISSQVARQVTSILELDTLLAVVVKSIQEALSYYFVGIWLLNESHAALLLQASASTADADVVAPDFSISLNDPRSILAAVCRTGDSYLANDVTQSTYYLPFTELPLTQAELALPLCLGQEILGALDIQSDAQNAFDAEDVTVLQTLADQIAIAIRNARLYALEKQLRKVEEERAQNLAELNANKDKFFSIVAHDLRGPFQPLLSWSYLLSKKNISSNPASVQEIGQNLYRAAKDFMHLLENLLEWARIQQGRILCTPTVFNLAEVVENTVDILTEMAFNKNIHVYTHIDATLHGYADVNMISAVIRNLLTNALKFTPGGGNVMVSARRGEPPANPTPAEAGLSFIEVSVADSGVGISPEDLAKLFRIDVHHTTIGTAQEHGAGLGLTLCKEMVERNKGRIWIESAVGQGATVTFTIPAAPPNF
ncbi:MAG TPA: response regulator [Anaerolineae bacterium]|nr:response regulator [Anaerolineae bacterium]